MSELVRSVSVEIPVNQRNTVAMLIKQVRILLSVLVQEGGEGYLTFTRLDLIEQCSRIIAKHRPNAIAAGS